ncbi:MAG TPA: AMIN domain-containing protein, partial [Archangium sp.]
MAAQPVVAVAQDRVQLNSITKIEVKGSTVEITGSRRPNFTTFTLSDPPRLVIDISEAVFTDVPKELKIGDGTITAIKTASYGSESAAIARILIGFERELETDIASAGTSLVVKLPADPKAQQKLI